MVARCAGSGILAGAKGKGKNNGEIQGSLHCATDGEAVRRFGRDDVSFVVTFFCFLLRCFFAVAFFAFAAWKLICGVDTNPMR
jgi:hypothetical protein